jgi:hypothetical protein
LKLQEYNPEDLRRAQSSLFGYLRIPFILDFIRNLSLYQVYHYDSNNEGWFN